jgi:biopolymer transport protein ExbD
MHGLLRVCVALTLLVGFIAATPSVVGSLVVSAQTQPAKKQQDPATLTVYVTKTGEKYHRDGCSSLRKSKFAVSLKEAMARGYGACKNCKPPRMGKT